MTIPKITASQKVVDYITENLARPGWKAGDRIPSEQQLSKTLGVSRSSIRPAIQHFIALGMVQSIQGKGTFIVSTKQNPAPLSAVSASGSGEPDSSLPDMKEIRDILEFRAAIEPAAAALAAARADPSVAPALQQHLHAQVASIGDSEKFIRHDMMFHIEIAGASGNAIIEKSLRDLLAPTLQAHRELAEALGYKDGIYYHSLVHKAIERGNADTARAIMTDYFAVTIRKFYENYRSPE